MATKKGKKKGKGKKTQEGRSPSVQKGKLPLLAVKVAGKGKKVCEFC